MGNGWDLDAGTGGSKVEFTKFAVGIAHIRVVDVEPFVRWVHWFPQFKRSANCPGKGCGICEIRHQQKANGEDYSIQMGKRFAMNVLNHDTGKVEIMEQGIGFFQDLKDIMTDLKTDGNSLIDAVLQVRRRGTTKNDTKYTLSVDKLVPLTKEEIELVKEKTDLVEYFKPTTPEQTVRLVNGELWDDVMKQDEVVKEDSEDIELR